jgi:hypothetical protein
MLGATDPKTLRTMDRLGHAEWLQGDYAEAEPLLSRTLEIQRRVLGLEHPDTLRSMNALAAVYYEQGKYVAIHQDSGDFAPRGGSGASVDATGHDQRGERFRGARASTSRPRLFSARLWRSSGECCVLSIPTR